jgi:rfaE bifunctional protein kinase chain/domain
MSLSKEIKDLFNNFNGITAIIIGDVMIDNYLMGKASRISPEAPVPVVDISEKSARLGGAANVALNIKALGATPLIYTVIGNDSVGKQLLEKLDDNNISKEGILSDDNRITTVKNRVISNHQQLLRFDEETTAPLTKSKEQSLIDSICMSITRKNPSVIIFEDYDKGVISENLITQVVDAAKKAGIPTVVDPKKKNFLSYKNVSLFKPNLRELEDGLNISINKESKNEIIDAVKLLNKQLNFNSALITLSEEGILHTTNDEEIHIPAHLRNIADVSGAGDTVVSVASLCLAAKTTPELLAQISNIAGGLVCEKPEVVSIDKQELLDESIKLLC